MMKLIRQSSARAALLMALLIMPAVAADRIPEYTIKAGYLYNFALLTDWPAQTNAGFRWCFYGEDKFGSSLDAMRGKTANGRSIEVRMISKPEEARTCQAVFVSSMDRTQFKKLAEVIADSPVLTVTDEASLARSGVMILLKSETRRVGLEIDLEATKRVNLNISARLLRLATVIE